MADSGGDVQTLTDEIALEPGRIGGIDIRVRGQWDRVEQALQGLEHDAVTYRWRIDSTGEPALYIEISLPNEDADPGHLLHYRDRVRAAVAKLPSDRPIYVTFVGPGEPDPDAADA